MIRNVAYKECICDGCGDAECISIDSSAPQNWGRIRIDGQDCDFCGVCHTKVCAYINSLGKGEEKR